jgi:hypothetical protein
MIVIRVETAVTYVIACKSDAFVEKIKTCTVAGIGQSPAEFIKAAGEILHFEIF